MVIAIIAILAGLLLPALSRAKAQAERAKCINNEKQLVLAWSMYADENNDLLPRNGYLDVNVQMQDLLNSTKLWVLGATHTAPQYYTNLNALIDPRLASFAAYIPTAAIYQCPSDHQKVTVGSGSFHRIRDYSMNCYFGWSQPDPGWNSPANLSFDKSADLGSIKPSDMFLFTDMNPGSVCHSAFVVHSFYFYHFPFTGHNRSGVLTFADGHIEPHRWSDPRTADPTRERSSWTFDNHLENMANNPDQDWLVKHATAPRPGAVTVGQ